MTKGKWGLAKFELGASAITLLVLAVAQCGIPLLIAYLIGDTGLFWIIATISILLYQLTYVCYTTASKLKKQFKAVDTIAQALRDAIDVANTNESIDIELNDVRPN